MGLIKCDDCVSFARNVNDCELRDIAIAKKGFDEEKTYYLKEVIDIKTMDILNENGDCDYYLGRVM